MPELRRLLREMAPPTIPPFDADDVRRRVGRRRRHRRALAGISGLAVVAASFGVGLALVQGSDNDRPIDVVTRLGPGPAGREPADPATPAPQTFVAVEDGRIALFDTRTGQRVRFLTDRAPGGGDDEPVLTADGRRVYFVRGNGTCSSSIWRILLPGGEVESVVTPRDAAATGVAVSPDGLNLAWVEQPCEGEAVLKTRRLPSIEVRTFAMGNPLQVQGKPAWAPDGRHLAYFYRGGSGVARGVHVLDTATARHADEGRALRGERSCYQEKPVYLPDGTLVVLTCPDGTHPEAVAAVRFDPASGERLGVLFTLAGVPAEPLPEDLVTSFDLSAHGRHAIYEVTTSDGSVSTWRWDGGEPRALSTAGRAATW